MHVRRLVRPLPILLLLALVPFAGFARANVDVGQKLEAPPMPALDGGKQDLIAKKAQANVIIFFRPQQEHSTETLRAMAGCEKEFRGKPVHWAAVVSDSYAKDEVKALVGETGIQMHVLVDEGDKLYGTIGVILHPTIAIADGDATLLAYEPFRKINYCDTIRARIQYALKEIDQVALEKVLNPEKALMPSDVKGAVANRHVKMGRMFAKSKNWPKAEESAREAIAKEPDHAPAHALLGDALAGKGDCAAAAKEYDEALRLDPKSAEAASGKQACGK